MKIRFRSPEAHLTLNGWNIQKHKISKIGMICFAKPVLTEDSYIVQKEEFSITCYMCDMYTGDRPSIFIRNKPIFSSEGMLHKDYDRKGSVAKKKKKKKKKLGS
jgi:hypothetical protein